MPQAARLSHLLAGYTSTADRCWFPVWEGFGALAMPTHGTARIAIPHHPMILLAGPLSAATTSMQQPPWDRRASLWWPADRTWCVATGVDSMDTYVRGSQACIKTFTADDQLEAMPVPVDQRITGDSDAVNPTPSRTAQ